jgi:ABC-type multidrug transport system fused ATPase/permease subunit
LLVLVLAVLSGGGTQLTMVLLEPLMGRLFPADAAKAAEAGAGSPMASFNDNYLEPWLLALPDFGMRPEVAEITALVLLIALFAIFFALTEYVFIRTTRMLGARMITDLRQDMVEHVIRLDVNWHSGRRLGDLVTRMTSDAATSLRIVTLMMEELIQCPFTITAAMVVAFAAEPRATLGMLILLPIIALPVLIIGPKVRRRSKASQDSLGDSTQTLVQMLSGIRVVKAFRMEEHESGSFRRNNDEFLNQTKRMVRAQATSLGITTLLSSGGVGIALGGLALINILVTPVFHSAATTVVFFGAIATVFAFTKRLTKSVSIIQTSLGSVDRVFEVFDLRSGLDASDATRAWPGLRENLRFERVSFSYPETEGAALQDVSFELRRGERIALVGHSGSGKSTLLDLVARFYDPTTGRILADGQDLRELKQADWLGRLAVVQQRPFLFQATIRENVRYGRPSATDEEVLRACQSANLGELLTRLPQGLDTAVGEGGARLSGGEAQRVTIARALLKDAEILLLDEATSALDAQSERVVQEALDHLMKGRTTFVIAHRLSTVRDADRILVLDQGRLIEEGSHEQLLAKSGAYARLWRLQAGEPLNKTTA